MSLSIKKNSLPIYSLFTANAISLVGNVLSAIAIPWFVLQKQGIGSKLIHEGLSRMRSMGAKGCVLEGSPEYYQRFGFRSYPSLIYELAPTPQYFMAIPFYDEVPKGRVEYHQAFYTGPSAT